MTDNSNIRKFILRCLLEAQETKHFGERAVDRVLANGRVRVGYWTGIPGQHKEVGWYSIPSQVLAEIRRRISVLTTRNFPKACTYNIVLHQFYLKPNEVAFDSPTSKAEFEASRRPLVITDPATKSNGTLLAAIIEQNVLITIMFMFEPSISRTQSARGIFIRNFANVESGTLRC